MAATSDFLLVALAKLDRASTVAVGDTSSPLQHDSLLPRSPEETASSPRSASIHSSSPCAESLSDVPVSLVVSTNVGDHLDVQDSLPNEQAVKRRRKPDGRFISRLFGTSFDLLQPCLIHVLAFMSVALSKYRFPLHRS